MDQLTRPVLRARVAFLGAVGLVLTVLVCVNKTRAVDISPSKAQGGTTNVQPNKVSGEASIWRAPFKWIFKPHSEAMKRINAPPNLKVDLATDPANFTFASNAVLKARMIVLNEGDDKHLLLFPTAQHFDFVISGKDGGEVYRYSADKEFSAKESSTLINRNDKLVYEDVIFCATNQQMNLPPGDYKLTGQITTVKPISVETSFQIAR